MPHLNRKTPATSSYNYHHGLPSPVCTHDETGFNYICHFPRNLALVKLRYKLVQNHHYVCLVSLELPFLTI